MDMNSNDIIIIIRKNNLKTKLEASAFSRTGKTKHAAVDPRSQRAKAGYLKWSRVSNIGTAAFHFKELRVLRAFAQFARNYREQIHPLLLYCINSLRKVKPLMYQC